MPELLVADFPYTPLSQQITTFHNSSIIESNTLSILTDTLELFNQGFGREELRTQILKLITPGNNDFRLFHENC